jgi:hypothetical protein
MQKDIHAEFAEQGRQRRQQQHPRRKGRRFGYFVLAVNALFLLWVIFSMPGEAAADPTSGMILTAIRLVLWVIVDVILGVVYLVLRNRR